MRLLVNFSSEVEDTSKNVQEEKSSNDIENKQTDAGISSILSETSLKATSCPNCSGKSSRQVVTTAYRSKCSNAISSVSNHRNPHTHLLQNSLSFRAILLFMMLFACMTTSDAATVSKDECDPTNPNACKFGATCELDISVRQPYYRCTCPKINCYNGAIFDPVCGDDKTFRQTYFNTMCLVLQECVLQRPIQQLCYGMCDGPCRKITQETKHHERCHSKDSALCQNGGLCMYHPLLKQSSCRCPEGFEGDRCQAKVIPRLSNKDKESCNSPSELLTIFAIILLAVVLLVIITCVCWRRRKKDDDKLWPTSEKDEKTPLRDSRRSEFTFPDTTSKNPSNVK